ncbi:MAG: hypothetical protein OQL19_21685 [Gammaproteobacteria bacterium]|nr:hypothetical protein [Gammaproteobacteria bacterium]
MTNAKNFKLDYSKMDKAQLLQQLQDATLSPADTMKVNKALRSVLRQEEVAFLEAERKAKEDTVEQQKLLKKTKDALFASRKEMTKAFADMNKIINTVSMLKNLEQFEYKAAVYIGKQETFLDSLENHIENLKLVKEGKALPTEDTEDNKDSEDIVTKLTTTGAKTKNSKK